MFFFLFLRYSKVNLGEFISNIVEGDAEETKTMYYTNVRVAGKCIAREIPKLRFLIRKGWETNTCSTQLSFL